MSICFLRIPYNHIFMSIIISCLSCLFAAIKNTLRIRPRPCNLIQDARTYPILRPTSQRLRRASSANPSNGSAFSAPFYCAPLILPSMQWKARPCAKSVASENVSPSALITTFGWLLHLMIAGRLHWRALKRQTRRTPESRRVRFSQRLAGPHRSWYQTPRLPLRRPRRRRPARARSRRA